MSGESNTNFTIPPLFQLAFEDNFNEIGQQPDPEHWTHETGGHGWGNGEVQNYTTSTDNSIIVDVGAADGDTDGVNDGVNGALKIIATRSGGEITSARIKSDIEDLPAYGYYEVRAKLPSESGAWPAIWLLGNMTPDRPWPDTGEIDMVEWSSRYFNEDSGLKVPGSDKDDSTIIHALHFRGAPDQPTAHKDTQFKWEGDLDAPVDEWHTYQLWWSPTEIRLGVDGNIENAHYRYSKPPGAENDAWPFDHPMDLIMNIAVGGSLGSDDYPQSFSHEMLVDYVRVYQGDWTSIPAADAYVAAAEGVVALASEAYADLSSTDWGAWGVATYEGLVDGAHKYTGVDYFGIVPSSPLDLSGQDKVHLTLYRENPTADIIFKLSQLDGGGSLASEGAVTIPASEVPAGRWVELVIPKSEFLGLNASEPVDQIVLSSNIGGFASSETLYVKELYMSDSTIIGPVSDVTRDNDSKGIIGLFGSDQDRANLNFDYGHNNGMVSETVSEIGDGVVKYSNLGYVVIKNLGDLIDASDSTTLHLSVWRTRADAELKVKVVNFDAGLTPPQTEDTYVFGKAYGNEVPVEQWVDLEIPLSELAGLNGTSGIAELVLSSHVYNAAGAPLPSYETVYLDNLYLSSKSTFEAEIEAPPVPGDDPVDVVALLSNDDDLNVSQGLVERTSWSLYDDQQNPLFDQGWAYMPTAQYGEVGVGDETVLKYSNIDYFGSQFGTEATPVSFDASSFDSLKFNLLRTDADAELQVKLLFAGGGQTDNFLVHSEYGNAVPAGQWHTLEIPLDNAAYAGEFNPEGWETWWTGPKSIDTHEVIGYVLTSVKYTQQDDGQGNIVDVPTPSRESIYMADIYFSNVPDAPRAPAEAPGYSADDVVSVFSDGYTAAETGTSFGSGSVIQVKGNSVVHYEDVSEVRVVNSTGFSVPQAVSLQAWPTLHFNVWMSDVDLEGDYTVALTNGKSSILPGAKSVSVVSTGAELGLVANAWNTIEVPLAGPMAVDFTVKDISLGAPASVTDLYLDNIFFSNGNPVPTPVAPVLVDPTAVHVTFADGDPSGVTPPGSRAPWRVSPPRLTATALSRSRITKAHRPMPGPRS